ncbi:DUF4279 domain-containing protein [Caballeronia sp. LZ029]|uniref:DUF4279 domain-containing protein n=1 Tax=Caballeronia sp. LZ029 TaxID=3038564 RepID=UPI00286AC41C|nr:DUF4279 domain-containing protein [Caballeronia sp. LZ029]
MNTHQLAHASFLIAGDTLVPEFWTSYLGVTPDTTIVKGQPFTTPSGRLSSVPGRVGIWGMKSKTAVQSDALEPHLRYLIARLRFPVADLRAQLEQQEARARFFCFWNNYEGNRTPEVPEDIRRMCEAMGVAIEIDEYR